MKSGPLQTHLSLSDASRFLGNGSVLTIGNFDGVHLGHQAVLALLKERARVAGHPAVALTFEPHPVQILHAEKNHKRLFPVADMSAQMDRLGVDHLIVMEFTNEVAALPAPTFLEQLIVPSLQPREIVVGHDFSFGAGRTGDLRFLGEWCSVRGIQLWVQTAINVERERVSSRRLREWVALGEMERVRAALGRPFYIEGAVVKGAGRGQTLGVPTINLRCPDTVAPLSGVYVTNAEFEGHSYPGVSNLGVRPTFETEGPIKLETHLLDFSGDLYGRTVRVQFLKFLRPERKFSSGEELVQQIRSDVEAARRFHQ